MMGDWLFIAQRDRRRQRLLAAIALFSAATIQIKYWVYYGHDCLRLNPYQLVSPKNPEHRILPPCHHSLSHKTDHQETGPEKASQHISQKNLPEHDHNSCSLCQSYQQLLAYLINSYHIDLNTGILPTLQMSSRPVVYFSKKNLDHATAPRGPPQRICHFPDPQQVADRQYSWNWPA